VTLIVDRGTEGARTHALVIGVGAYPYLLGGEQRGKVVKDVPLSQLSSPPVSARAFADWLAAEHDCPAAKLGTVEMLLSPGGRYTLPDGAPEEEGGSGKEVEAATWDNVKTAAGSWWRRCDTNPDNIALFYFCGHGLEVANLALLLRDFGADDLDRLTNAINLHETRLVMEACAARHQVFIVDACREVLRPVKDYPPGVGRSLFNLPNPRPSKLTSAVLHSTSRGGSAYGDREEISKFTSALLKGLGGEGADDPAGGGEWVVTLNALFEATGVLLAGDDQEPTLGGDLRPDLPALHLLQEAPKVRLELACTPEAELAYAELAVYAQPPETDYWDRRPPVPNPWELTLPAGHYRLEAYSSGSRWAPPRPARIGAKPPRPIRVTVKVGS
jgi:hypothetical protein